jgi:pimeloyl-ACP methyl ester carboxylesterase
MRARGNVTFYILATLTLNAAACSPRPSEPYLAAEVSPALVKKIRQNTENGRLPPPRALVDGDVPPVPTLCDQFRAKIPAGWFQDWIEVPEDPSQSDGQKIRVFYYGKLVPGITPSVFFNGGPAESSHGSFGLYNSAHDYFTALPAYPKEIGKSSFVFIDQRGTGCSDFYPQPEGQNQFPTRSYLERLSHYGSQGIVADAERLRAKIWAGRKWIAVGQSYGAHIVHRYVVSAPEGLKAAFAHANAITPDMDLRQVNRYASQARVVQAYFARFSGDRGLLKQLIDYLTPERCFADSKKTETICGYEAIDSFASWIGFTDNWLSIHQWISAMVSPAGVQPQAVADFAALNGFEKKDPRGSSHDAFATIDWVDRGVTTRGFNSCEEARKTLLAQGFDLADLPMTECSVYFHEISAHPAPPIPSPSPAAPSASSQEDPFRAALHAWVKPDLLTLEKLRTALNANPGLGFYLYSGHLDPWVPVENFAPELKAITDLKNVHYREFPDSGHDGYYSETWFWTDLLHEIMNEPEQK